MNELNRNQHFGTNPDNLKIKRIGIKKIHKKHLPKSLYISGGVFLYKNMTGETYWKFS